MVRVLLRQLLVAMVAITVSTPLWAQMDTLKIPRLLSFQGVLIQPDGTVYSDGTYLISVKLFTAIKGGDMVYSDEISTQVVGGVFNLIIGEGVPLDDVDFTKQLWFEIGLPGTSQVAFEPRTKLTTAPYAAISQIAATAGALAPGAKGAVLSVNGAQGDLSVTGTGGLVITRNGPDINIDASGVVGNLTITTIDSVIKVLSPNGPIIKLGVNDSSIATRHLRPTGILEGVYGDSTMSPRISVGKDGRITSVQMVPTKSTPIGTAGGDLKGTYPNPEINPTQGTGNRVVEAIGKSNSTAVNTPGNVVVLDPQGRLPATADNRLLYTANGKITETPPLSDRQFLMGRTGQAPAVTTLQAGAGVKLTQEGSVLRVELDSATNYQAQIVSGVHINNTGVTEYKVTIDATKATPVALTRMASGARILVTMESTTGASAYAITGRSEIGFTVDFTGGIPPGSAFSWMILNL